MAVYVDSPTSPFRRMLMCHMLADTTGELLDMADKIGVDRRWIQNAGTHREHFDICKSKRFDAIRLGAVAVSRNQIAQLLRRKRKEPPHA